MPEPDFMRDLNYLRATLAEQLTDEQLACSRLPADQMLYGYAIPRFYRASGEGGRLWEHDLPARVEILAERLIWRTG